MKTNKQKYANVALILSGVATLATVILAIIFQEFALPVQICLALAVIGLAVFSLLNPEAIRKLFTGRQAKHGSNSLIMTVAVLVIVIVINLVGYNNTVQWDLTADKSNSLADETVDVLKSLNQPVIAQAFFSSQISSDTAEALLRNYKANSNGNFTYEFIDPNENPVVATEAGITRDGSIVLKLGENKETVTSITETQITSALIRLMSPEEKVVYVLTGHGETSFASYEDAGYYYAVSELKSKNYTINELNLLTTNAIPDDAKAILVVGPQKPLSTKEVDLIRAFVDKGGSLLVMYEPTVMTEFGDLADPLAAYLSETWNIDLGDDMVIDLTTDPVSLAVASTYSSHVITDKLEGMVSILPTARSLSIGSTADITPTVLATTSDQSWAETDFEALKNNEVAYDQTTDTIGPLGLAIAAENSSTTSRVVVFGDSEFADNYYYQYYGNADLFLNSLDWVCAQDELINLTARTETTRTMVTPNRYVQNAILLGSVILIPLVIIITAIIVFVKRHREV